MKNYMWFEAMNTQKMIPINQPITTQETFSQLTFINNITKNWN